MKSRRKGDRPVKATTSDARSSQPAPVERPAWLRWLDLASHVAVPAGFFLLILCVHPFRTYFEFDPDEGNNVIKALLLQRGHPLYSETWSDQAPLFTYALKWTYDLFGATVNTGRVLVLLCSSITLWGVYQTIRLTWGHPHALAAVLLVILSPYYTVVSVSVMLGLPSLMWAVLSLLALTVWHQRGSRPWLVLSAVAMALSILVKLFTAFLVPIFVVRIIITVWVRQRGQARPVRRLVPAAVWSGVFAVVAVTILLVIVSPSDLAQLIEPHLAAQTTESYVQRAETADINWWLSGENKGRGCLDILALALVGFMHVALRRQWLSMYVAAWAAVSYAALSIHSPVWYHHLPLMMIPVGMLAGIAVGEIFPGPASGPRLAWSPAGTARLLLRLAAVFGVVVVCTQLPQKIRKSNQAGTMIEHASRDRYLTAVMKQYAPLGQWVFADRQMFAFQAGLLVPPELSVTSQKRLRTKTLTDDRIVEILKRYRPAQLVFCGWRMKKSPPMARYLHDQFDLIYADERQAGEYVNGIYLRKGTAGDPLEKLKAALAEAPASPQACDNIGRRLALRSDANAAMEYYRKALNVDPDYSPARIHLADTLLALNRFDEGFGTYRQGLEVARRGGRVDPYLASCCAWRLATVPDPARRDGPQAERLVAPVLNTFGASPDGLGVLAAAYAEQGRFQDAVRAATQAVDLARKRGQSAAARKHQERLALYQANHPCRETVEIPTFP